MHIVVVSYRFRLDILDVCVNGANLGYEPCALLFLSRLSNPETGQMRSFCCGKI